QELMKESDIRERIAVLERDLITWFPDTLPKYYPGVRVSILAVFLRLPDDVLETLYRRFHFVIEILPADTESFAVSAPPPIERVHSEADFVSGALLMQESRKVYQYIFFMEPAVLSKSSEYIMGTTARYLADAYLRFVLQKKGAPGEGAETLAKEWGFIAELVAYLKER